MPGRPPPILVTGSHRSGTTWVGKVLARGGRLAYLHEPFSPLRSPGWLGRPIPHWYVHVGAHNEASYAPAVERMLALRYPLLRDLPRVRGARAAAQILGEWPRSVGWRLRGARPLVKDPIALFSSEWLADRFGVQVVVMIRHPAAFAGSLKRLGWGFDFRNWAEQPTLLEDLLSPYAERIRAYAARQPDLIDQAVLLWNAIHHAVLALADRRPGWAFVRHEDLAAAPRAGFRDLAGRLGVAWTARMEALVDRLSRAGNPWEVPAWRHRSVRRDSRAATRTWRGRLSPAEVERVRDGTGHLAGRLYGDEDWEAG